MWDSFFLNYFLPIFIHDFNRYLLSIYYVPGTVLGSEATVGRKADLVPCSRGAYSLVNSSSVYIYSFQCLQNLARRSQQGRTEEWRKSRDGGKRRGRSVWGPSRGHPTAEPLSPALLTYSYLCISFCLPFLSQVC